MSMIEFRLTLKQECFCEAYLQDFNGSEAASNREPTSPAFMSAFYGLGPFERERVRKRFKRYEAALDKQRDNLKATNDINFLRKGNLK